MWHCKQLDLKSNNSIRFGVEYFVAYSLYEVQSLKVYGVKFQNHQDQKAKDIKDKLDGKLREYPKASYVFFFFIQNFLGFLFGRVLKFRSCSRTPNEQRK